MALRGTVLGMLFLGAVPVLAADWPPPVAKAVREREQFCAEAGGKPVVGAKFIRQLSLDGDARADFILNDSEFRCTKGAPGFCGSGGCSVEVFLSSAKGGLKSVLTELGSGYAVRKTKNGSRITVQTRNGPVTYRFAGGCAVPVAGGGERSC
jgi:hypothetical protein